MTATALRFESYRTGGGSEMMLVLGPKDGPQLLFLEAFLEERNFLRRTMVMLARKLAEVGIGCALPDLPGTGESLVGVEDVTLMDWRRAAADSAATIVENTGRRPVIASLRGAALIDDAVNGLGWWRFAPASGADLLRPMRHAERLGGTAFAGYRITADMATALESAVPVSPPGPLQVAEVLPHGTPLWRRAEPAADLVLVDALAIDLASWVATCATA